MKKDESYYDLLKVDRRATVSDIVTAYHTAKNAFSKDSVAAYSLFSGDEADFFLKKLEEAYLTLSNMDRKREYDRQLEGVDTPRTVAAQTQPAMANVVPFPASVPLANPTPAPAEVPPTEALIAGDCLRLAREAKGMSIEDVSRLTKIPTRTIKAIEADDYSKAPARVYVQGFVTNLAKLYRLDPVVTSRNYLQIFDKNKPAGRP